MGSCGLEVQHLSGMREVPGSNSLWGNNLCNPSPFGRTINSDPNTSIPMTYALIYGELKDLGIPPSSKVAPYWL